MLFGAWLRSPPAVLAVFVLPLVGFLPLSRLPESSPNKLATNLHNVGNGDLSFVLARIALHGPTKRNTPRSLLVENAQLLGAAHSAARQAKKGFG